jgi:microcin C transport system substrate-binding protein
MLTGAQSWADAVQTSHGLSAFGDLKYGPDFEHFDYVNPDAPKGGTLRTVSTSATGTFDSLNGYITKGDSAAGVSGDENLIFDSLMVRAADEPDAVYGLVASHAELLPGRWVTFQMREEATFSDGSPVTAEDAKTTFDLLKTKGHPGLRLALRDVENAEVLGPHRIKYTFRKDAPARLLPMLVAGLPIFSAAYYAENDFEESSLDPPLGSGPYAVGNIVRDRSITYERREDYWAKDLPVNRGRWNFDTIRFEYFKDHGPALEALMAGALDLREEFSSKFWATQYETPAVEDGRIIRATIEDGRPAGTQGYWINTRREKFSDPRVREAIALAFDFEWSNKALFYGLYNRTNSFFENAPFEASGAPSDAEIALLKPYGSEVPQTVFSDAYEPPVTDGSGRARRNIRAAQKLLDDAGWKLESGKRVNAEGEPLEIEFLDDSASFARITNPYIQNLKRLGIDATLRQVDRPQYQRRGGG